MNYDTNSADTIYIELRDIYDGWSVAKMPGGTLMNRWEPTDIRYIPTQKWIEMQRISHEPLPTAR